MCKNTHFIRKKTPFICKIPISYVKNSISYVKTPISYVKTSFLYVKSPDSPEKSYGEAQPGTDFQIVIIEQLRTHRRISHAYVADVPDHGTPFLVTDALVNIQPTLEDKRDIVQNAIDLARVLGMSPRVAILSASPVVHSKLSSSMDAAALCKMLERHQIAGGIVDGPLPFDAAIDPEVARLTHPDSPVAGQANVLVVPHMETGDMLVKQLHLLADADVAGIVLGAQVPVILTNATDSPRTRLASAALALLLAHAKGHLDAVEAIDASP